jgi:hypothetical protein
MAATHIPVESIKGPLLLCLDETFSKVHGMFLDKGTTFFETLETISPEEASTPASPKSATIAAQLEHVCLYLDVLDHYIHSKEIQKTNWREIWETVQAVSPEEWEKLKARFNEAHSRLMTTINSFEEWDGEYEFAGALSILVHTAYHLGGIRQALGVIRANNESK